MLLTDLPYQKAKREVEAFVSRHGFEYLTDVNFLVESMGGDIGDTFLFIHWEYKIVFAYRFGQKIKVLYGRQLKELFCEKIYEIDRKYGGRRDCIFLSKSNHPLMIALASVDIDKLMKAVNQPKPKIRKRKKGKLNEYSDNDFEAPVA